MFPIIIEMQGPEIWRESVLKFTRKLREVFGDRLLRVIALPSPDDQVYESNVLVVLRKASLDDVSKVVEVAVESGERINPLVVDEGDEAVMKFLAAPMKEGWEGEDLRFAENLRRAFGDRLLRVIALPSPDDQVYESNVLVVLRKASLDDVSKVVEVAVESGERINPLVVDEGDEAVMKFLAAGGRDV